MTDDSKESAISLAQLERLLSKVDQNTVLVGGQALAFWVDRYGVSLPPDVFAEGISKDADFLGNRNLVRKIAVGVHGTASYPPRRAITALVGQVTIPLADNEYLNVDIIDHVVGVGGVELPHQRLLLTLKSLENCTLFHEATVYVDGFREFSEYERRVLARLGKVSRQVEITLPMDPRSAVIRQPDLLPEELSLFHSVETAYRRLRMTFREEGVPVDDPVTLLTEVHRFTRPGPRAVDKHAFETAIPYVQKSAEGIELLAAPDRTAEVDAAASNSLTRVMEISLIVLN